MEVREIQLLGRRFMWSNDQNNPTMIRIDRPFCTAAWEELRLDPIPLPHSASTSEPLSTTPSVTRAKPQNCHLQIRGTLAADARIFGMCSAGVECTIVNPQNALFSLHIKLSRTAKALTKWARKLNYPPGQACSTYLQGGDRAAG
jgi:hypothetical protein